MTQEERGTEENEPGPADPLAEFGPVGRALFRASRALAIFGGITFSALVAMSIVSIMASEISSLTISVNCRAEARIWPS